MKPLEDQEHEIWPERRKHKIWLHLDNCRVHNSQDTQEEIENSIFKRAPHSPYSPDLARSGFFLFGYVKGELRCCSFKSREELYEAVAKIINEIQIKTKRAVFDEWEMPCQWVSCNILYK